MPKCAARRALTLIELLAVIGVLALVGAIILPAMNSARESARSLQCLNNMKQIGLALAQYQAVHGCFPGINNYSGYASPSIPYAAHYYSPFTRMLSYLENSAMYNRINMAPPCHTGQAIVDNQTYMAIHVGGFVCPSERNRPPEGYGRANYRFSTGVSPWIAPVADLPDSWTGPFTTYKNYVPADFRDGLSNTVGMSERVQGDWLSDRQDDRTDYLLTRIGDPKIGGAERVVRLCQSVPPPLEYESRAGESWFFSGFHYTNYNHCLPPNPEAVDCSLDATREDWHRRSLHEGVFSARSYHNGGVNVLLMDGSARRIRNEVSLSVWRGYATRSGGEVGGSY